MITKRDAEVLSDLIDVATETNWPTVASAMIERGYTGKQVEQASAKLADMARRTNPISADDF